jgi:hypothetical protein
MKRLLLCLIFFFALFELKAQSTPNYNSIKLEKKEDFNDQANSAALQASTYILSTPLDFENAGRRESLVYLIKWMSGTPDYSFELDDTAMKLCDSDKELIGIYMAAMAKFVLENKSEAKNNSAIKLQAVRLFVNYANDSNNKVKLTKEIKKAIKAEKNRSLEEYLKN